MSDLRLLKVKAIMKLYNCSEEEAVAVKKSGVAPEALKASKAFQFDVSKNDKVASKKVEIKEDDENTKETN